MSVRIGARGQSVRDVQQALQTHGQPGVAVDGLFGRQTREAVRAFQREHNLREDGIVGPQTAAALGLHGDAFEPARRTAPGRTPTPTPTQPSQGPGGVGTPPPVRPPPAELHPFDRMAILNNQLADRLQWYRDHGQAVPPAELAAARRFDEANQDMVIPIVTGDGGAMDRLMQSRARLHEEVERAR